MKYNIKFMFEYSEIYTCVWSINQEAANHFGGAYPISLDKLPITDDLRSKIVALCEEFQTSLNWDSPQAPSPWTEEHRKDFKKRATEAYSQTVKELGDQYEVENWINI